jgi:hypothetical protein
MFRVSSVPRPGRNVFADLIRPSEPPWGIIRIECTPAEVNHIP